MPAKEILENSYGMDALMHFSFSGKKIPVVQDDDVVLLVPAAYTGHTDWTDSPLGLLPGSYTLFSVINSTLGVN